MELKVLRHFLAIVENHNISSAAVSLHMSQPSLSRQISELEQELGVKLFVRGAREIRLTPDGQYLVARARELISLADKTMNNLQSGEGTIHGELHIGTTESSRVNGLMNVVESVIADFPEVRIQLHTGSNSDIRAKLDSGLLDFGIVTSKTQIKQYASIDFSETESWGINISQNNPLSGFSSVTAKLIGNLPILVPEEAAEHEALSQWLTHSPNQLKIVGSYNLIGNTLALVNTGHVGILSLERTTINENKSNIIFKQLNPVINEPISMIWKSSSPLSNIAQIFLERIQAEIKTKQA